VAISGNFFQRHCHLSYQNQKTQEKLVGRVTEGMNQRCGDYTEQDFFTVNEGSSKLAAFPRYALACSAAQSFPCSISSTVSEGAIQFLAFMLYTVACAPRALSSENSRRCSPPTLTLTSAQTPWSNLEELLKAARLNAGSPIGRWKREVPEARCGSCECHCNLWRSQQLFRCFRI
jgi:hypothetical protein